MAASDYRLCDVCASKAFYDSNLNYEQGRDVVGSVRNAGQMNAGTKLDYLGDWVVICDDCAKTHECKVVPKSAPQAPLAEAGAVSWEQMAKAWRNRFITERMNFWSTDNYEVARAKSEGEANEFEDSFIAAMKKFPPPAGLAERLTALVDDWRQQDAAVDAGDADWTYTAATCADQLLAALTPGATL